MTNRGFVYLIENEHLACRKLGITRDIDSIKSRYGKGWRLVAWWITPDLRVAKRAEQITLGILANKYRLVHWLDDEEMVRGWSETFAMHSSPSNRKLVKLIHKEVQNSYNIFYTNRINVTG